MANSREAAATLQLTLGELPERLVTPIPSVGTEEPSASVGQATPFVKWAGGKRSILEQLLPRVPSSFNTYYEPFVGGAALFFALNGRVQEAVLSDTNFDLVVTYNAVKKDCDKLIALLENHAAQHDDKYYYRVRSHHSLRDPVEVAARFLYLNKTCYNGLYRVNRKGEFNVPVGRYTNPGIVQANNLLACSRVLQRARIELREFDTIIPQRGDFVYFDPPYHPTNDTSFTSYTEQDFSEKDQLRLRDFALRLTQRGVSVMLSNSDTKFTREIYGGSVFHIATVQAPRNVNCKPAQRNSVSELLITNY